MWVETSINRSILINCLVGKCPFPDPNEHHHERSIHVFSGLGTATNSNVFSNNLWESPWLVMQELHPRCTKNKQRRLYEIISKILIYILLIISGDILHYCKENIVRLSVYLERPYVTKYETDQVTVFSLQMHLKVQVTSLHAVQTQMTKTSVDIIAKTIFQFFSSFSSVGRLGSENTDTAIVGF
jgi:hypothetical protein